MKTVSRSNLNSKNLISSPVEPGQLTWFWPVMVVFSRLIFAVLAQTLVAALFFRTSPSPMLSAGNWWPVYGTLIDLGCLILILALIKKEGVLFRDLVHYDRSQIKRDLLIGLGNILWVFPLAVAGIIITSLFIFNNPQPPSVYSPLPAWAAFYSLLIFPVFWGGMEQATYQGYALPRLVTVFKSPGLAISLVAFGWGIQHIALPFIVDWRFMLFRFLSFLPLAIVMTLVYLRKRRLIPLMVAHWAVDMFGILSGIILPMFLK
jgi:membrane protease YdiL (CAAX protease family)